MFDAERLRPFVQHLSDVIAVLDQEGRIMYASPSIRYLTGRELDELTGAPVQTLLHPRAGEVFLPQTPGASVSFEATLERAGSLRWLEVSMTNLRTDPAVGGVVMTLHDITDRISAEEAGRKSEERFRDLVEDVPAIMYLAEFGAAGRWRYVSPYIHTLLGWKPEEWMADPWLWYKSLDPSDRDRVLEEEAAALLSTDRDFFQSEYRMVRRDGIVLWVRDEFRISRGSGGEPIFMRGVIFDVTHRKDADSALQEKDERIRSIFDHSPMGIGLVDLEGHTIETNRALRQMLGYSEEEFATLSFSEFTHPEDVDANIELFKEMAAGERDSFKLEKRFIHKDGQTVWTNLVVSVIRDATGAPVYALGMTEDISDRKALEDQLRQAQKMEAIGHLAGGIAHDFNNLLAVITNCANFLAEDIDASDPRYEDIKDIAESSKRGADLVRQLLAFSRKEIVRPEVVDLNEVVSNMQSLFGRTLGENIDLETRLAPVPCMTQVDLGQIEQILVNLAVNARDAMSEGGKILITSDVVEFGSDLVPGGDEAPESYVRLTFTDTGVGMPEDVQKRIFEPFFTTKSRGHGTGLGLATTYGAVRQAGGHISVWSQPGEGTTFTLYFPCALEEPSSTAEPSRSIADHRSGGGRHVILLVEDDDALRRLTKRMLERNGFEVLDASHPNAAIQMFEANGEDIDAVLTDVIMPGGTGKDLVDRLRAITPGVKFLFMSGYPEEVVAHHGVLDEGVPFVEKPFTESSIIDGLRSVVEAT